MTRSTRTPQRGGYLVGSLLLVAGLVLAVFGIGTAVGSLVSAAIDRESRPVYQAPGSSLVRLERGSYVIMQETGRIDVYGSRTDLNPVTISPDEVTVTPAGGGAPIAVYSAGLSYHDRDEISYTSAVSFTVPSTGSYRISVTDPHAGSYLLIRALTPVFHDTAGPLAATALAGMLFLTGLVIVLLTLARSQPGRPVTSPPHWDGSRWRR